MDQNFALYVVDKCEYAVISMVDPEGEPYCLPITIVRSENTIYFHTAMEGRKIDILNSAPSVCMACVGDTNPVPHKFTTEFESAIVTGTAYEVTEEAEKILALKLLCQRHASTNMKEFDRAVSKSLSRTGIWKIKIREITGKRKKYDRDGKEMKFGRMEQTKNNEEDNRK